MASTESPEQTHTTTGPAEGGRFARDSAPATTATGSPASGRATASLVLGILSIPGALMPILGIALGVIGLVLGMTARGDIRRAGASTGKVTTGIVLSSIGIVLAVALWAAAVAINLS